MINASIFVFVKTRKVLLSYVDHSLNRDAQKRKVPERALRIHGCGKRTMRRKSSFLPHSKIKSSCTHDVAKAWHHRRISVTANNRAYSSSTRARLRYSYFRASVCSLRSTPPTLSLGQP
jgi:hypothetical protein